MSASSHRPDDPRSPGVSPDAGQRFARHPRLAGHDAAAGADTAGTTWAGRLLSASPFADDDGTPDAQVRAALAAARDAAPGTEAYARAEADLLAALASARIFAAVEAVASQVEDGPVAEDGPAGGSGGAEAGSPLRREVVSDMAGPVLTAPDGRRATPVFTGTDTLAAWRPGARPVPVRSADAARAAIEDACDVMLLDIGTDLGRVLRLSQVWALAQERPWLPAHEDPTVLAALARASSGRPDVVGARLADGSVHGPGVTRVVLTLRAGLSPEEVRACAQVVGDSLATDPDVRIRIDDVAMVLRSE